MRSALLVAVVAGCGGRLTVDSAAPVIDSGVDVHVADTQVSDTLVPEAPRPGGSSCFERAIDGVSLYGLALDTNDDIIVGGRAYRTSGYTSLESAYVARYDGNGTPLWSKQWGEADGHAVHGIAIGPSHEIWLGITAKGRADFGGGVLETGDSERGAFLVSLDATGTHRFSRRYGGKGLNSVARLVTDPAGNVILCGGFDWSIDFGGGVLPQRGDYTAYIAKLDSTGRHLWSKSFGPGFCHGLAVDAGGRVLVTGAMRKSIDFGGGPLAFAGANDVFVVALEPDGRHVWSKGYGGSWIDEGIGIAAAPNGDVLLTGGLAEEADLGGVPIKAPHNAHAFMLRLDREGRYVSHQTFGGEEGATGYAVAGDEDGNVWLGGYFRDRGSFLGKEVTATRDMWGNPGSDAFMLGVGADGALRWLRAIGGNTVDLTVGVKLDSKRRPVFAGWLSGPVMLDGAERAGGGFIMKCAAK